MGNRKLIIALLVIISAGCSGLRKAAEEPAHEVEPFTVTGFRATGNEPFWALEIEFDSVLKFTSLTEEYPSLVFPFAVPERKGDLSKIKYYLSCENYNAVVTINREECTDSMKGDLFPYGVTVSIDREGSGEQAVFSGCGQYRGPYRLNDIWILKEIDGIAVQIFENREHPRLEVDLAGRILFGFGGCNRFQGRGELVNNTLVTGNLISTKMYCEDTHDTETRFMRALTGKTLVFKVSEERLMLTDGETELTFSRAD